MTHENPGQHKRRADDTPFSQAEMDEVMLGSGNTVRIYTKRERVQQWMVNQRNSKKTLEVINTTTQCGIPSLVAWALTFANESRSNWKRGVGRDIATWISMPSIILVLYFESELGCYFKEAYAWHNCTGPLNKRSGFRMLEIFDSYLGFEVPWWNSAVDDI